MTRSHRSLSKALSPLLTPAHLEQRAKDKKKAVALLCALKSRYAAKVAETETPLTEKVRKIIHVD